MNRKLLLQLLLMVLTLTTVAAQSRQKRRPVTSKPKPVAPAVVNKSSSVPAFPEQVELNDTTWHNDDLMQIILDSLQKRPNLKGLRIKLRNIHFESRSAILTSSSRFYLDTVATVLNKLPALTFEIGGHTDNVGQTLVNQPLSTNRAKAVRDYLVNVGNVVARRITYKGYGESRPVSVNSTELGRQLNRRVEMEFVGIDNSLVNRIYLRDGRTLVVPLVYTVGNPAQIFYKTDESAPLQQLPCKDVVRIEYSDKRIQLFDCLPKPTVKKTSHLPQHLALTVGGLIMRKGIPDYDDYLPETPVGLFVAADIPVKKIFFVGAQYMLWQNTVTIGDRIYWNRIHAPAGRVGIMAPLRWLIPYGALSVGMGFSTLRGSYTRREAKQNDLFYSAVLGLRGVLPISLGRKQLAVTAERSWGKLNYFQTGLTVSF